MRTTIRTRTPPLVPTLPGRRARPADRSRRHLSRRDDGSPAGGPRRHSGRRRRHHRSEQPVLEHRTDPRRSRDPGRARQAPRPGRGHLAAGAGARRDRPPCPLAPTLRIPGIVARHRALLPTVSRRARDRSERPCGCPRPRARGMSSDSRRHHVHDADPSRASATRSTPWDSHDRSPARLPSDSRTPPCSGRRPRRLARSAIRAGLTLAAEDVVVVSEGGLQGRGRIVDLATVAVRLRAADRRRHRRIRVWSSDPRERRAS